MQIMFPTYEARRVIIILEISNKCNEKQFNDIYTYGKLNIHYISIALFCELLLFVGILNNHNINIERFQGQWHCLIYDVSSHKQLDAKVPGHWYPQWWLSIHCFTHDSFKNITFTVKNMINQVKNMTNQYYILFKWPVV